jgi:excinuclease ABC subunit A
MPASDIDIKGAREHNLRDVSLVLPRNHLICLTGVSGSGKSSLAFDTLYAEGQRRYVESLSSYARHFLGQMPKPDVDYLGGLSPSISISQKSTGNNPRSTVGTVTEIYDFLRVLFARVGQGHCPKCERLITAQSREEILARIQKLPAGAKFSVLAPLIRQRRTGGPKTDPQGAGRSVRLMDGEGEHRRGAAGRALRRPRPDDVRGAAGAGLPPTRPRTMEEEA